MDYKKEIYASVEIADHEIRMVVGEFYETRFNILRVEKTEVKGIEHKEIQDEQLVVNAIIKTVKKVEEALGFRIDRVLMSIPSVHVTRHNKKVSIVPEASSKRIRLSDIQKGLNQAITFKPESDLELVNVGCIKYITNGITSRKMPLEEVSDILIMNVDLLFADKEIVYSYARCVEKAGLEIMDICLDSYAVAQEAAVFEQTVDKYVILVNLSRDDTTLSLFSHGKLVSSEVIPEGYGTWLHEFEIEYQLSNKISFRLLQNTCTFDTANAKDSVIYIWSSGNEQKQLTEKQVCEVVVPKIDEWIQKMNETCLPIIESGDVRYLITGEGCEIQSLAEKISIMNAPAQIYVPQTIGARDCAYVTCLGLFYSWKEQQNIRYDDRISVDASSVEKSLNVAAPKVMSDEGGFTKKLKSILLNDK
ncbi:cell division protein FtsA [Amedibacillus sp. YH-ame10]